jgi:hypothetical protein
VGCKIEISRAIKSLDVGIEVREKEERLRHYKVLELFGGEPDSPRRRYPPGYMTQGNGRHEAFSPEEDLTTASYFLQMCVMRDFLLPLLIFISIELKASKLSGFSPNAFEISSIVFGAGFTGYPTLVSQGRDGSLSGSSLSSCVQHSYVAFQILHQVASAIKARNDGNDATTNEGEGMPGNRATLRWEWEQFEGEEELQQGLLETSSMDGVVFMIIPLLCTNAIAAAQITDLIQMVALIADADDPLETVEQVKFAALYCLKTNAYEKERPKPLIDGIRPLSRSLIAQQRLLSSNQTVKSSTQEWITRTAKPRTVVEAQAMLQLLNQKIEKD